MKGRMAALFLAFALLTGGAAPAASAAAWEQDRLSAYANGQVLVRYVDGGMQVLTYEDIPALKRGLAQLEQDETVLYVQPNYTYETTALSTSDPYGVVQWALENDGSFEMTQERRPAVRENPFVPERWRMRTLAGTDSGEPLQARAGVDINAQSAWLVYGGGSRQVVIALIDTGVDTGHEDLQNILWVNEDEIPGNGVDDDGNGYVDDVNGWNFYDNTAQIHSAREQDSHATHGAGTIAATADNGIGIAGIVNSETVKIMVIKALGGESGTGSTQSLIRAIEYARHNGASICNLSLGSSEQIGSVWPLDYTDFCEELGLSDGLSLKPEQVLTRGQAAVLLCRTLEQTPSNGSKAYYTTMSKVASTAQVMLLDTAASLGAEDGLLMVYELEGSPGISYYEQAVQQYDGLVGTVVTLLLDGEGEALASIPRSTGYRDVVIDRAKAIGIVDRSGVTHRIGSGAVAIVGGSAYSWGSTGYIQMDGYAGKTARLFYEDGSVSYVYLTTGATDSATQVAVADDMQAGRDMVGVLSTDGRSVTLSGSGLVLTGGQVDAAEKLRGTLVVAHVNADGMSCYEYNGTQAVGALDLTARMLGGYALAPECSVYERTGDGFGGSFVYSLSGEQGEASVDFEDITWTDRLSTSYVEGFRLNRAGQVDVILLEDVTGNCYTYGKLIRYTGTKGIVTQTSPKTVYSAAVTVTNGEGTSKKYLSSYGGGSYNTYYGIALQNDASGNQQVVSTVTLTQADDVTAREFFTDGEDWTVRIGANTVPVSRQVQVYVETTEQWLSGYDAVRAAVTSGSAIEVHYDRTLTTGAQARVIVVRDV